MFAKPKVTLSPKKCSAGRFTIFPYILLELLWKSADKSAGYTSFHSAPEFEH